MITLIVLLFAWNAYLAIRVKELQWDIFDLQADVACDNGRINELDDTVCRVDDIVGDTLFRLKVAEGALDLSDEFEHETNARLDALERAWLQR